MDDVDRLSVIVDNPEDEASDVLVGIPPASWKKTWCRLPPPPPPFSPFVPVVVPDRLDLFKREKLEGLGGGADEVVMEVGDVMVVQDAKELGMIDFKCDLIPINHHPNRRGDGYIGCTHRSNEAGLSDFPPSRIDTPST